MFNAATSTYRKQLSQAAAARATGLSFFRSHASGSSINQHKSLAGTVQKSCQSRKLWVIITVSFTNLVILQQTIKHGLYVKREGTCDIYPVAYDSIPINMYGVTFVGIICHEPSLQMCAGPTVVRDVAPQPIWKIWGPPGSHVPVLVMSQTAQKRHLHGCQQSHSQASRGAAS